MLVTVKRLTDLPMLWSEQWRALGLADEGNAILARFLHRSFGCLESIAWSKSALNPLCAATQATRAVRASRRRGGLAPKRGLRRGETSDRDAER